MIVKECIIPERIKKLEALLRRIPETHEKKAEILSEFKKRMAGYRGEKSIDYHLSTLSDSKFQIYHNLRLSQNGYFFQIDLLILCNAFALILEVKNMSGELRFDQDFNQMIRTYKDVSERHRNPVLQAKVQALRLKSWLRTNNCPDVPIHYLFVNSNEKAIIRSDHVDQEMIKHICNSEFLFEKISQLEKYYQTEKIATKELRKIKRLLLTKHTPDIPDILKQFQLSPREIRTGVQCPDCHFIPMNYHHGFWNCPQCNKKSKDAHLHTVNDHFLLIKPTISNAELRNLLHIDSTRVAHTIFISMNLPSTGKFKDRVYHPLPEK